MTKSLITPILILFLLCFCTEVATSDTPAAVKKQTTATESLAIVLSSTGQHEYGYYADLFVRHLQKRCPGIVCQIVEEAASVKDTGNTLLVYVGMADLDERLKARYSSLRQPAPTANDPGLEGFVLEFSTTVDGKDEIYIAGTDKWGVLFGLGKLYFLSVLEGEGVCFAKTDLRMAPAYHLRNANCQLTVPIDPAVARLTGARKWEMREGIDYFEETLLMGANAQMHGWGTASPLSLKQYDQKGAKAVSRWRNDLCIDLDLPFIVQNSINGLQKDDVDPSWIATHFSRDPRLVCPSIPAAREALLKSRNVYFQHCGRIDYFVLCPADVAGCHCDKCKPWANTFYDLAKEMTEILHRYHPDAKAYVTNQEFDHAENELFFNRLRTDGSHWLAGFSYGPAGSENSTYGYLKINKKWNQYPGCYPDYTFLKSRLNFLWPDQDILSFPDITHWKRAENGIKVIDPILSEVYHRRTFNARPAYYYRILTQTMPYIAGSMAYTEGIYDDFNKFLFLRRLWQPSLTAEQIALEYYTHYCGDVAGEILAQAVFVGERNYAAPVLKNAKNIESFYARVTKAADLMPSPYRRDNWRFRMLYQRAVIDLYLLRKTQLHQRIYDKAMEKLSVEAHAAAVNSGTLQEVVGILKKKTVTDEMQSLKRQAERLDNELNEIMAMRCYALSRMEKTDNVGIGWLAAQLDMILAEQDATQRRTMLNAVLNYDRVGPHEFYDNCGTVDQQPHFDLDSGELYYGTGSWPVEVRPSQRYYNYSVATSTRGLVFRYEPLDPTAAYEVTACFPDPGGVSFALDSTKNFDVFTDAVRIGSAVPTSQGVEFFTFAVPRELTADGRMTLEFRPGDGARFTCISEVWIRKAK